MLGFAVRILCIFLLGFAMHLSLRTAQGSDDADELGFRSVESKAHSNKRVLILYTHRQMSPINMQWHTGIVEAIRRDYDGPIDVDVEYMDVVLHSDPEYFDDWSSLLKRKYSKYPPDVIIPVFFPALTFLVPNRNDLFPGCPIVFCAIPESFGASLANRSDITGVGFVLDFKPTVNLITQLLPKTSKLMILSGNSKLDEWFLDVALRGIAECSTGIELVEVAGLSPAEAAQEFAKSGPNTVALMLTCELDNKNNRYTSTEYLKELKKLSTIPIFGCYDTILGQGIVGGHLISPLEQGKVAGKLAARILNGESADRIPELLDQSDIVALDAQVLEQFGIPNSRLPVGSKLINVKTNVWNQYGKYFALGLAALFAQSAIIVSLLINRRKRIEAESQARTLAGRILTAGEDERRYLARELHDDVSQRLAAVSIETGALENKMSDASEVKLSLGKLKKSLINICDDLHRMSRHMHPSVLDDFGLPEALQSECNELTHRWGTPVEFQYTKGFPEIPKSIALCVYRVAQESLWNAIRHSGATKIQVQLKSDPEFVYLDIQDDGRGFDPNVNKPAGGLGLASMAERIRLAGGTIKIHTAEERGVAIEVVVPIPETTNS